MPAAAAARGAEHAGEGVDAGRSALMLACGLDQVHLHLHRASAAHDGRLYRVRKVLEDVVRVRLCA